VVSIKPLRVPGTDDSTRHVIVRFVDKSEENWTMIAADMEALLDALPDQIEISIGNQK
jgi:pimeloyl-ACP methyl ester carboxylesterase